MKTVKSKILTKIQRIAREVKKDLKKQQKEYPYITKIGLTVNWKPYPHVKISELNERLEKLGISEKFSEYYGCQTQREYGPYPSDIEACLCRIYTGKLTGTQHPLLWD